MGMSARSLPFFVSGPLLLRVHISGLFVLLFLTLSLFSFVRSRRGRQAGHNENCGLMRGDRECEGVGMTTGRHHGCGRQGRTSPLPRAEVVRRGRDGGGAKSPTPRNRWGVVAQILFSLASSYQCWILIGCFVAGRR